MKWIAALVLSASAAFAQEDWPFAGLVDACLESVAPHSCINDAAVACMNSDPENTQTTFGMMTCHLQARDVWDTHLNNEYTAARAFAKARDADDQQLFPEYAVRDDQVLAAQRAWVAFRDANCAMAYGVWGAGSMRQIASAQCLMRMTGEQAIVLRAYRTGMR